MYNSIAKYDNPTNLINSIEYGPSGPSSSVTLSYDSLRDYNVIEFRYKEVPNHKLTVNYYCKVDGGSYTLLNSTSEDVAEGKLVTKYDYNSTYNSTLRNGHDITNNIAGFSSDGRISFNMPSYDVTLNIYYQYGKLNVQKVIRYNNGSLSSAITNNTYDLTSSRSVNLTESLASGNTTYYYFKYVNGSTTKYWHESGYTKGSDITVAKGKYNVTVKLYYGLRRLDYAHLIKSGTTYRNLENGTNYIYNNWNGVSNATSAKNTPWYRQIDSTYIKLEYASGKYLNRNAIVSETDLRRNGTSFSSNVFNLGAMVTATANDSTRVEFYYNVIPSTKVIVRHFVKQADGTYKIDNRLANKDTVVKNNGQEYNGATKGAYIVANNGYSQRKSVCKNYVSTLSANEIAKLYEGDYSEFYEIDRNDQIIIDRSRTLMLDGMYYNCIGFKTQKSNNKTPLAINATGVNTTSSLQQRFSGVSEEYVYVDYYYNAENYSKDVYSNDSSNPSIGNSARLKFLPKASGTYSSLGESVVTSTVTGAKENANIAYVPVTENLKPYVVTDICRVRTARYSIALKNNELVYNVAEYKVWGVSDDNNMANVQSVIGSGLNQVYNNNTYMNIKKESIQSDISNSINYMKNIKVTFNGTASLANTSFKNILNNVSSKKTEEGYYYDNPAYNIASNKYNGSRQPTGNISYKEYTITSSGIVSKTGNTNSTISAENSMKVNIYTPVAVGESKIKSIDFVNHSNVESNTSGIIQQGVEFNVVVSTKKDKSYGSVYGNITNTGKYVKYWYLMFDFDVTYGGRTYTSGSAIKVNASNNAYAETTISGIQAITNSTDMAVISSTLNHVKAVAATINLPNDGYANTQLSRTTANKIDTNTKHIDKEYIKLKSNASQDDGLGMQNDSYYLVSKITDTISIGRIFDFEITDCLDVNFKDVFRDINAKDNTVNSLTGTRYFSGIRKLLALDSVTSTTTNSIVPRSNLVVGAVTKILPLGPYKHITNTYIQSVKLGYRFSFDFKTSGYYDVSSKDVKRSTKITPSYYYISKDGKTYNDNIRLYYKNSSGEYVNFEKSDYTIYYKPNDGYRNTYNSGANNDGVGVDKVTSVDRTTLTTSLVGLNISKGFTLSPEKSMTTSDNKYLQAWYGEFKVPNSTIVVAVDEKGNIDINKPLTDGYIGVKFDIECIDKYTGRTEDVIVTYSNNDKGLGNNAENTSQWDYEGYLGFKESNVGSSLNGELKIQLENGVWKINNDLYNKIKGTVILYDLDNKASNDFE